ncbi:hypothetical protein OUZ56_029946 [Daphnia magna]|uniref:Uncharacterized protein n=1 Tax=Daphnia magna TaxID=35525 RepID=A0ABR0B8R6_9CRUS|nr:hypothetical protein OUZ56_029946 [Daphnia magna]
MTTIYLSFTYNNTYEFAEEIEILIDLHQNTAGAESSNSQTVLNHLQDTSTTNKQHANEDENFDAFEGTLLLIFLAVPRPQTTSPLSFKRILCNWAAFTMQKKSHLTYLLELLKEHRPKIDFDTFPSSGKQLMFIDGRDIPQPYTTSLQFASTNSVNRKKHPLPPRH